MFDLRYHVASLAAVFLALAVGIILGVAISGKVRGAEDALNAQRVSELEGQLERQQEAATEDAERLEALEAYVERTYSPLMTDRLAGESTAVVLFGSVPEAVRTAIEATLRDSGGVSARVVALDVPLDPERVADLLAGEEDLAGLAGEDLGSLGQEIGSELAGGTGEDPLFPRMAEELVAELEGSTTVEATGVVVARSLGGPGDAEPDERVATETFLDGLMRGLRSSGVPVVGVTSTDTESRAPLLAWYRASGVSTVDHVDSESGRLALALLLAGGVPGNYGFLPVESEDGPIPPVLPEPSGG
jgi:hypothetical protein